MANPTQRRKARSGSHKAVRTTKKVNSKRVAVKGPEALVKGWDKRKTPLQNYKQLGLLPSLSPHLSGGIEKSASDLAAAAAAAAAGPSASSASTSAIPKGYGRIVRDAEGNIIDVIMADDDSEDEELAGDKDAETPWGTPLNEKETAKSQKKKAKALVIEPKSETVKAMEAKAASAVPLPPRSASTLETHWLVTLVHKHGRDTEAMAKDLKANVWQKSKGEILKSVKKAGGWEKLERIAATA